MCAQLISKAGFGRLCIVYLYLTLSFTIIPPFPGYQIIPLNAVHSIRR